MAGEILPQYPLCTCCAWLFYSPLLPREFFLCKTSPLYNRLFSSSPGPLFKNEGKCSAFDMEIIFHSYANKTYFHKNSCAPSLILKVRVFGTRKWPISKRDLVVKFARLT